LAAAFIEGRFDRQEDIPTGLGLGSIEEPALSVEHGRNAHLLQRLGHWSAFLECLRQDEDILVAKVHRLPTGRMELPGHEGLLQGCRQRTGSLELRMTGGLPPDRNLHHADGRKILTRGIGQTQRRFPAGDGMPVMAGVGLREERNRVGFLENGVVGLDDA
jgi:hypothetical protein